MVKPVSGKSAADEPEKKQSRPPSPSRRRGPGRPKSPSRVARARNDKSPEEAKKSPGRKKSASRTKSPSRNRSPVAEEGRSESPVRRSSRASPSRKSPSRAASKSGDERSVRSSSRRQIVIEDSDEDSDDFMKVTEVKEKPKAAVMGRTRNLDVKIEALQTQINTVKETSSTSETNSYGAQRRTTRSSQNREVERVVHLKHFDSIGKKLGEFSDDDEITELRLKLDKHELASANKITEYGGTIGVCLLIALIPLFAIALNVVCDDVQCSFKALPNLSKYKSLDTWLDLKVSLIYLAFLLGVGVLTAFPFGGKTISGLPNKQGKLTYNTNGLFGLFIVLMIVGGLHFKNIPSFVFIIRHLFKFLTIALITGVILSLSAYACSSYVPVFAWNVNTVGRNRLYSFYLGREVNPRLFGLIDMKLLATRWAIIGSILINTAYFLKGLGLLAKPATNVSVGDIQGLNWEPTLLVYYAISLIYLLDAIAMENVSISSYKMHYEGFGFAQILGSLIYPFIYAPLIRHIVDNGVKLNRYVLAITAVVFLAGYLLYRLSNNQKNLFKKNPYSPAVAHFETIPTCQGNKLLASGFWGIVRHPNYLGDILIHTSFGLFVYCVPPMLGALAIILSLIYRSIKDNNRCRQKYGASWDRYCGKVKHILIPKIY